jgi:hypothetical protein
MKKIILFFLIFFPAISYSQYHWNLVEDSEKYAISSFRNKHLFRDSIVLVSGIANQQSCKSYLLLAYKPNGEKLWAKEEVHDVITTDSNYIYTAGIELMDDVLAGNFVLTKYNSLGEKISNLMLPLNGLSSQYVKSCNIHFTSDRKILVSSPSYIFKSDKNLKTANKYMIEPNMIEPTDSIKGVFSFSNPNFYLFYSSNKIFKTDTSFKTLKTYSSPKTINQLIVKSDTIYALSDFAMVRMDSSFKLIDTLYNSNESMIGFEYYKDGTWVFNKNNSFELVRPPKLNNNESQALLLGAFAITEPQLLMTNKYYIVIGNSLSSQIGMYGIRLEEGNQSPLITPHIEQPDISLVDFEL